jgi:hypothetical protein
MSDYRVKGDEWATAPTGCFCENNLSALAEKEGE